MTHRVTEPEPTCWHPRWSVHAGPLRWRPIAPPLPVPSRWQPR